MNMRRNLIRYLPDILKRSLDIVELMKVQENGLIGVWDGAQTVFNGQFITTADEYAIARFEDILDLVPEKDENLDTRRKAVLMAWRRGGNPGLPALQEIADLWNPGYTELEYQYPLMILIWFTADAPYGHPKYLGTLMRQLRVLAPANVGFEYCYRYHLIKELHRQVSVSDIEKLPLRGFAGGSGLTDRTRGSGLLAFGPVLIVRKRSKINVAVVGNQLVISSAGPNYEAPEYEQIGDGLWEIGPSLTVAADSKVAAQINEGTLYITSEEG